MTDLRRLALSCLLLGWDGPVPPRWLLDALDAGLGGVVLFASNLGDGTGVDALTDQLRRAAGHDIVIALDEEGGDVTRLDAARGSSSPGAAALGHLDDVPATESVYRVIGARCADAGVTLNLAPVADVNVDPLNPVIGLRAFSDDAGVAARHVAAAVRGIQASGVAACLKHFPGHGATRTDSHRAVPTLVRSRDELEAVEFTPFRAGISAGARAVMTGHLLVPALDDVWLATTSAVITSRLLRDELGFTGTVVTDALEMRALSRTVGIVEGFVQALLAGADAIETGALDYPELVTAIPEAVGVAVDSGRLDVGRIEDAARRTAELARPSRPAAIPPPEDKLAERCLEIHGPLPRLTAPLVVECRAPSGIASGHLPWSLGRPLAELLPGTDVLSIDEATALPHRPIVLAVRDPQRHPWQRALIESADVVVDCGWPSELPAVPVLRTRGVAPVLMQAAARALAGGGRT